MKRLSELIEIQSTFVIQTDCVFKAVAKHTRAFYLAVLERYLKFGPGTDTFNQERAA